MGSFTWTGKEFNSSWAKKKNWEPEGVPKEHDEITVPGPHHHIYGPTVPKNGFPLKKLELLAESVISGSTLVVEEQFDWGGALLCGVRVANGAVLRITSPEKWLGRGAVLEIAGTAEVGGVSSLGGVGNIEITEDSVIRNLGTFTARASVVFHWNGGAGATFENLGTFAVSSSLMGPTSIAVTFDDAAFVCEDVIDVQGDATLRLIGRNDHTFRSGARVVGDGRIVVDGRLIIEGFPSVEPGANLEIARDGFLTVSEAQPGQVRPELQCKGKLFWTGGWIAAPVKVMAGATLSIEGEGEPRLARGATLENLGTAEVGNSAHLDIGEASRFVNQGTFSFGGGFILDYDGGARSYFDNEGAFVKTASTEPSELRGIISLTNAATVDLRGGSLRITEGAEYIQTGGQTTLGGGTLGEEGGVEIWGGTLLGPGTVEGDLILRNVGTLSPGGHSLGSLSVTDSYKQAPAGTLILRFGAADHDRLDVVGEATLDGSLEVGLEDGFLPEVGKRLTVMTYASRMGGFAPVRFRAGKAPNRRLRALYGEKDLTLWVDLAAIGSRPRLSEAYERLIANGWSLGRRNILIGNSDVDLENKILYIDDDEVDDSTVLLWIYDAVLQAYQEQDDFRRQAILDKRIEIFSEKNNLTDLESMARVYEWAAWFWIDRTGNFSEDYRFMDDMVLAFTGRAPRLLTEHRPKYNILSQPGTRDESTGFKREFRDNSSQVRYATFSIQASLRYGRLGWVYLQERELLDDNAADFRLNNQCLDTAGRLLTSPTRLSNIGEILRTDLGDPSQTEPWDGPPGGVPDP